MPSSQKNSGCVVGVVAGFFVSAALLFYGVILILGSSSPEYGDPGWLTTGLLLIAVALVIIGVGVFILLKLRPLPKQEVVQRIDLTGDVAVSSMQCKSCGGALSKESISVEAGAIYVTCPYCRSHYQLVEEPKW